MNSLRPISILFWISAAYDGIIGIAFLFFGMAVLEAYNVTPPNHVGYLQFPAALLIIFALMFAAVARNPMKYRHLIPYGILLKVAYCSVVFGHWAANDLPWIWKPFAICDILFGILFVLAYVRLKK
jgi:hypothetical protein